jgi:hypothetical protein
MSLTNTKVGDKLIVGHGHYPAEIAEVTRTTKTQVHAGRLIFNRRGNVRGASVWSTVSARSATPDDIAEVREESLRRTLISTIQSGTNVNLLRALPTKVLQKIADSLG